MTPTLTDQDLLVCFRNEDRKHEAFSLLVQKYQQPLYSIVRKMVIDHDDANDVLQEALVKIWHKLHTFNGNSELFTWMYRVAVNEALRFLQRKKRRSLFSSFNYQDELTEKVVTAPLISGNEVERKLQQALLRLPEKQRLVFNMKYYEELPYEKISAITGTSVGGLKASYHHAVKKIENYINHESG